MLFQKKIKLKTTTFNFLANNIFPLVFFTLIVLYLLIIIHSRLLPFIDIPYQLAIATIYKYYGQSSNQFADYFMINSLLRPNIIHMVFTGSKLFSSVELANVVYYCLYIVLLPFAILALIKKIGGNKWFALFSFFLLFNYSVKWGFVENTMAIPLYFFLLYFTIELLDHRSLRNEILVCFLLFFLTFTHLLIGLLGCCVFLMTVFLQSKFSSKKLLRNILVTIPTILTFAAFIILNKWYSLENWHQVQGQVHMNNMSNLEGLLHRIRWLFVCDYIFCPNGNTGCLIVATSSIFIIFSIIISFVTRESSTNNAIIKKNLLLFVSVGMSLILFLLLPEGAFGIHRLYSRFSVFYFLSFIVIASSLCSKNIALFIVIPCVALCFMNYAMCQDYFFQFNVENKNFNKTFFPKPEDDKVLAAIVRGPYFKKHLLYRHFQNYYITWKQGIAVSTIYHIEYSKLKITNKGKNVFAYADYYEPFRGEKIPSEYSKADYILFRGKLEDSIKKFFYENGFMVKHKAYQWSIYQKLP